MSDLNEYPLSPEFNLGMYSPSYFTTEIDNRLREIPYEEEEESISSHLTINPNLSPKRKTKRRKIKQNLVMKLAKKIKQLRVNKKRQDRNSEKMFDYAIRVNTINDEMIKKLEALSELNRKMEEVINNQTRIIDGIMEVARPVSSPVWTRSYDPLSPSYNPQSPDPERHLNN